MALDFEAMLKQSLAVANQESDKNLTNSQSTIDVSNLPTVKLESTKLSLLPDNVYYIPNFISPSEAHQLEKFCSSQEWTQLSQRKLHNWGGTPHLKYHLNILSCYEFL